jgi:PAS domain S-box-containing protein
MGSILKLQDVLQGGEEAIAATFTLLKAQVVTLDCSQVSQLSVAEEQIFAQHAQHWGFDAFYATLQPETVSGLLTQQLTRLFMPQAWQLPNVVPNSAPSLTIHPAVGEQLAHALEVMPFGVILFDASGTCLYCNETFRHQFGHEMPRPADVMTWISQLLNDGGDRLLPDIQASLHHQQCWQGQVALPTLLPQMAMVFIYPLPNGGCLGICQAIASRLMPADLTDTTDPTNTRDEAATGEPKNLHHLNEQLLQVLGERQQFQHKFLEATQQLQLHVENSPLAVIEWDQDLRVKQWLGQATTLFGWTVEEAIGQQLWEWDLIYLDDLELMTTAIVQLLQGHETRSVVQGRVRPKHGEVLYCDWYNSVIFDPAGKPVSVLSLVHNVSDRKRAEVAIQESEEFLRGIYNGIELSIFTVDVVGEMEFRYTSLNPYHERLTGIKLEDLVGKTPDDVFPEAIANQVKEHFHSCCQSGEGQTYEEVLPFEGKDRFWLTRLTPIRNSEGKVVRLVGTSLDITERKTTDERLRLLESAVDHANDVIVITKAEPLDAPGPSIVYVNSAFTRETGYTAEEVIGKSPRILQGNATDREQLATIRAALEQWQPVQAELVNYRKDRTSYWTEITIVPLTDKAGWVTHWMSIQRNITARKQAEAEILKTLDKERELNDLKSRFISMTSHEFRTPLTTIQSSFDIIRLFNPDETERQELFDQIQSAIAHMVRLMEDVLFIGRAEAGQLNFLPTYMDLEQFCQEVASEVTLSVGQKHTIMFACQCQGDSASLEGYMDGKLLRQILTNLLSNAIKYSPIGSLVNFELTCTADQAIFVIQDSGIGISKKDQTRLFEFFYRASNSDTIPGTGIGLAIVKKCVDLHDGAIALESDLGKGTTITVTLPFHRTLATHENSTDC